MKRIISSFLALLVVLVLPLAAFADPTHSIKAVTLFSSAARTASANGTAVSTGVRSNAVTGATDGFSRHAHVFLNVTAASGSLDITLEGSVDGGTTYFTLTPSAAWTTVTATGKQVRRYEGPLPPLIRAAASASNSPAHTFEVKALLGG